MSVFAPMLGHIWRVIESYELDPAEFIDSKHYRPGAVTTVADRVSFAEYDALQARAAALVKDPAIGLRSARYLLPSHLGALGHAWLASSTLRTALLRGERFHQMFHEQLELRVEELPDRVRASYHMHQQPCRPGIVGDAQLACLLVLCRFVFGDDLVPVEVTLKRQEPSDPGEWKEFFGSGVKFGQALNSLSFSNENADRPLTGSNSELVAIHEEMIQRHLARLDRGNILNRARMGIMEQLPSGRVTEENMALALNMSKRTLHRKLRENDETFRSLLVQVRMDLAKRYIRNLDYSITEIAFLLGFTDTSAFSRAFRKWFGRSPTQAREQNRAA